MQLELTEILTCPACGPDRGFVVFVDRLEQGTVVQGRLDCPQCEQRHRLVDGVLHLAEGVPGDASRELQLTGAGELTAALLGVPSGPEVLLLDHGLEQITAGLAAQRPDSTLLCLTGVDPGGQTRRVHRIVCRDTSTLPFRSGRLHGAILAGGTSIEPAEIVRVLVPGSRIVILQPGAELSAFEDFGGVRPLATDSRAAVLVASPLSAV